MSKPRVQVDCRNSKMFIVVPHGHPSDDVGTASIGDDIARNMKFSALINHNWKRADKYSYAKSEADLNNFSHLIDKKTFDYTEAGLEFLEPIVFTQEVVEKYSHDTTFIGSILVHGMTDAQGADSIILGIGLPDRLTISMGAAGIFAKTLDQSSGQKFKIHFGKPGGNYSARSAQNLCQVLNHNSYHKRNFTIQIELSRSIRDDKMKRTKVIDAISIASETLIKLIESNSINHSDHTIASIFPQI